MSCSSSSTEHNSSRESLINRSSSSTPLEKDVSVLEQTSEIHKEQKEQLQLQQEQPYTRTKETTIQLIERSQVILSVSLLSVLAAVHFAFPSSQDVTSKFFTLQYTYPGTDYCDIGLDDAYFVATWIVILIFIRSSLMDFVLGPVAKNVYHITNKKSLQRFKEQGWSVFYYTLSFGFGFYLYRNSDYYLNCDNLYIGWPHDKLTKSFKSYYLIQASCWLQQIFVLNIEAKRKDHLQMFTHHIITLFLVFGSYYYYFTRVGHVILVVMDFGDIFLSLAKMLKYCGFTTLCDLTFLFFLISWIVLRHGVYIYVVWHAYAKSRDLMKESNCVLFINSDIIPKRCFSDRTIDIFVVLLAMLQVLIMIWMYLIMNVFIKVVTGSGADDVRSDSEEDED